MMNFMVSFLICGSEKKNIKTERKAIDPVSFQTLNN